MKDKSYYSFDIVKKYVVAMATILQDFQVKHESSTYTTTGGSTTTLIDTTNLQYNFKDDYWNGYVIEHLTGTNAPQTLTVTDYDDSTGTLTFSTANAINAGDTYKLVKTINVPITYAQKNKLSYLLQRKEEEDGGDRISTSLPRIGFILSSITRDSTRGLNRVNRIVANESGGTQDIIYVGIPYNFTFEATIWTKQYDDLIQIIEQMLPIFSPDVAVTVKEIPSLNITRDVHITMDSGDLNIQADYDETSWRTTMMDFSFNLAGWLYPNLTTEEVIQTIFVNMKDLDDTDLLYRQITLT
jgi:hypothetical protein